MKKLVALLLAAMLLLGCAVTATAESNAPVTLRVLTTMGSGESGLENVVDEMLSEQHPNITLEWELITWEDLPSKMQQYMQSGMPDIVIAKSQDANNYGAYGVWADLSETDYIQNIFESCLDGVTIGGQVLGMPYIGTYGGVYYNRALFKQLNLEVPTTFDELKAVCETLKANSVTPFATHFLDAWFLGWEVAIVGGSELLSASPTWGTDFHEGKVNCDSPEFRQVIDTMKFIIDNTWADTYSVEQTTCDARFLKGEAAMQMDGSWVATNYAVLAPDFDYGIFPFPTVKGDGCLNMEPNTTFFKSASTEHSEAVDQVLRMMASPEMASAWSQYCGEASLVKNAESFATPAQSDIDKYAAEGRSRDQNEITNQLPYNEFWADTSSDFTEYVNGDITLETLIERANGRADVCGVK